MVLPRCRPERPLAWWPISSSMTRAGMPASSSQVEKVWRKSWAPCRSTTEDLRVLRRWAQASSVAASLAQRAKLLLLAAEGISNTAIAQQLGITRPTVIAWRQRYTREGLDGLADRPRPGRPQTVRRDRRAQILATTLAPPAQDLGITHWSSRLLAAELGVSHSTIARVWAEHNVKPWQTQTFKFSTDPELDARVRDVVGLYLHPPEHAIVLCVDEKSQIQALERTQLVRPVRPGRPERHTHDYLRHGTATLFAALEVATGHVTDAMAPRHRHTEFLAFLQQVAKAYPRRRLQVICDNYVTHKHQRVQAWLGRHPRVRLHFTPTYASWLNLVEVFFSIVERQALRRGDFASVEDLVAAIRRFVIAWNRRCQPFTWTKDADTIVGKFNRKNTAATVRSASATLSP
jgi:transposase